MTLDIAAIEATQGFTAQEFFEGQHRGTFVEYQNIIFLPRRCDFPQRDINLSTRIATGIGLKIGIVGSPMRSVSKSRLQRELSYSDEMAIIAVLPIHEQVSEVSKSKYGFIKIPVVFGPSTPVQDVEFPHRRFSHIPVTDTGKPDGKVIGVVTKSFRMLQHHHTVSECMDKDPLIVSEDDILLRDGTLNVRRALSTMASREAGYLIIVDPTGHLKGLAVESDLKGFANNSKRSGHGVAARLRFAAINTDREDYERRIPLLIEHGANGLCIDTSHGHTTFVLDTITWIKKRYPETPVIAGNIVTARGAYDLINAGADALRVGMGPSDICTTNDVIRFGAGQPGAVYHVARVAEHFGIPVIADGGIKGPGDAFIAFALGANTVMIGTGLAPLLSSAAPLQAVPTADGKTKMMKIHFGEASRRALDTRVVRRYEEEEPLRVPEGIELHLEPSTETVHDFTRRYAAGLLRTFSCAGVRDRNELRTAVREGQLRMEYRAA